MSFTKELWINTDTRELVQGFLQSLAATNVTFTQGDLVPLRVYLLKQLTNNQGRPFQDIKLTTETLKVALGRLDVKATGGTFTLGFDANNTTAIQYNDTAANIDTLLNALASITSAGGVTVTGDASGPWTVTFTSNGARSGIIGDTDLVTTLSDLIVTTVTEGDVSTQEVQVLKLKESPVAVQTTFTIIPDPTIAVTEVIKGVTGVNEIQKVKIDQVCQDGSFTLSFNSSSAVIEYGATATEVVTALESTSGIAVGDVAVQKISDTEYNITFQGLLAATDVALLVANDSGLIGFSGFEADFDMGSFAVEQLLNGETSNEEGFLEVELYNAGDRTTVLKIPAIVENDLIDESVTVPPNNGVDWDALLAAKVAGPGSAVDENIMIFDGTTGKVAKDSGFKISDLSADPATIAAGTDNNQTGTSYTLVLTDADNTTVGMDNASANEVTIPLNASVAFPVGTKIPVMQDGVGVTTVTGDTGVTVNGVSAGSVVASSQYNGLLLHKRAANIWSVSGG